MYIRDRSAAADSAFRMVFAFTVLDVLSTGRKKSVAALVRACIAENKNEERRKEKIKQNNGSILP
jgi:hypothetical protein